MSRVLTNRSSTQNHVRMTSRSQKPTSSITVVCRKRPLIKSEIQAGNDDAILLSSTSAGRLQVTEKKKNLTGDSFDSCIYFDFDRVYGKSHSTAEVYLDCVKPMVSKFLNAGGKNSIFTYGQTGSGKTYTILGCPRKQQLESQKLSASLNDMADADCDVVSEQEDNSNPDHGLLQTAVEDIFDSINKYETRAWIRVSCYEIYVNRVFDLFNGRRQLRSLEGANGDVSVHGLEFVYCCNVSSVLDSINQALRARITGANARNKTSSRGHLVCQLEVVDRIPDQMPESNTDQNTQNKRRKSINPIDKNRMMVSASAQCNSGSKTDRSDHPSSLRGGKLAFIDLAGAERGNDSSGSTELKGGTNGDGANINKSLLALKECIRAIDSGSTHVPFRDSILTKVLREYLVPAEAFTLMMVHVTPASSTIEPAINSLHYASMVHGLRKRCQPLLQQKPAVPHASETYIEPDTADLAALTSMSSSKPYQSYKQTHRRYSSVTASVNHPNPYRSAREAGNADYDKRPKWRKNSVNEQKNSDDALKISDDDLLNDLLPTPPRTSLCKRGAMSSQPFPSFLSAQLSEDDETLMNANSGRNLSPSPLHGSSIRPPTRMVRSAGDFTDRFTSSKISSMTDMRSAGDSYVSEYSEQKDVDNNFGSKDTNNSTIDNYPDLRALRDEITEAQKSIRSDITNPQVFKEQKHRMAIIIHELMFSDNVDRDPTKMALRTELARLATSVEGEMYVFIRRKLQEMETINRQTQK